ncbi:hypothetical protein ACVWYQ_003140 [Bradyrhizobium sp. USDA 3397]
MLIGATPEGRKELVGFTDGARESAHDWRNLLLDLKRRGLDLVPQLAIADGALGFWKAAGEVWPKTREQRCWVHKTANVLGNPPRRAGNRALSCSKRVRNRLYSLYFGTRSHLPCNKQHVGHRRPTLPLIEIAYSTTWRGRHMSHCGVFRIRILIASRARKKTRVQYLMSATRLGIILPLDILWSGIPWTEPAKPAGICEGRQQPHPSYR